MTGKVNEILRRAPITGMWKRLLCLLTLWIPPLTSPLPKEHRSWQKWNLQKKNHRPNSYLRRYRLQSIYTCNLISVAASVSQLA